ncbi:hypothetical protein FVER14953_21759 [Fusarium verticillioides]|nr:hypothetical protein FVER14953_21759 [Fusarium verticillioides]
MSDSEHDTVVVAGKAQIPFKPASSSPASVACLSCIRRNLKGLEGALLDRDQFEDMRQFFLVSCVYGNPNASACDKCNKGRGGCHPPLAMLEGDWANVVTAMEFTRAAITTTNAKGSHRLHPETRKELACACYWLVVAFLTLHNTHSAAFRFSGNKKLAEAPLLYAKAVATRRRRVATQAFYNQAVKSMDNDLADTTLLAARLKGFGFALGTNPYSGLELGSAPDSSSSSARTSPPPVPATGNQSASSTLPPAHPSLPSRPPAVTGGSRTATPAASRTTSARFIAPSPFDSPPPSRQGHDSQDIEMSLVQLPPPSVPATRSAKTPVKTPQKRGVSASAVQSKVKRTPGRRRKDQDSDGDDELA